SLARLAGALGGFAPLPKLLFEPANRLGLLALGGAVELDELQEQIWSLDPHHEVLKSLAVEATGPSHLPPDAVGAIVELDRGEQPFVVRVALRETPRAHGVMVLARARPPLLDLVLERVVDEGDEAQPSPLLALHALRIQAIEQVRHVCADPAFRMSLPWLSPGKALEEIRILGQPPLQVILRLKSRNQILCAHAGKLPIEAPAGTPPARSPRGSRNPLRLLTPPARATRRGPAPSPTPAAPAQRGSHRHRRTPRSGRGPR